LGLLLVLPLAFAYASVSVSIQSLSPSTNISVGTTVSFTISASGFTSPVYSLSDSFSGGSASNSNINSSGNFSWTPIQGDIGTHNFTITISDSYSNSVTVQEQIIVSAAPSISIQSLSPGSAINVGQTVSFTVASTGFNSPSYSLSDSFSGSTVSNSSINSSGNFSWTPATQDIGSHTITIMVTDAYGHSSAASESLTVNSVATFVIQSLSPGSTVVAGNPVTFTAYASGFTSPAYTISDSFGGSTVSNAAINSSSGYFNWTPTTNDIGTHTITIWATDSSGHSASITQQIVVQSPNITITSISPSTSVSSGSLLSFSVVPAGFINPSYTISDSYSGTTITNSNINSSGYFSWTPVLNDSGTHTITVYATDASGHSANTSVTIYVYSNVGLTLAAVSPGSTVAPGTAVTFTISIYGFTNFSFSLTDSFSGTSLSNGNINSSGVFTWTPTINDVGIHSLTIMATDGYGHNASANTQITVSQPSHVFNAYLSLGSTGDDVIALQNILTQQGFFSGSVTGYYGPLTKAAVQKFQTAHGIEALGVVGSQTSTLLNQLSSPTTTQATSAADALKAQIQIIQNQVVELQAQLQSQLQAGSNVSSYQFLNPLNVGSTGTDVTELQKRLTAEEIYSGPITGYYGSLTQAAVKKYQTLYQLTPLGNVGPATRATLNK